MSAARRSGVARDEWNRNVVIVGGTQGLGRELAQSYADGGREVVVTGRDQARAEAAANDIGGQRPGDRLRPGRPAHDRGHLADVGEVDFLVLAAIERDVNNVRDYDIDSALRLVTLKLVGYTEVIHTVIPRLGANAAILIYGGLARDRPYPGSTTVTTVNGGVTSLVRTLVTELAPHASTRCTRPSSATARNGGTCLPSAWRPSYSGRRSGAS